MNPDRTCTMEAPGAEPGNDILRLWKYSKIITRAETGLLSFNTENFNEILKTVSCEKKGPVGLVAIIGPVGSGKSFYTNLLIQYLKYNGTRGWLSKLMVSGKDDDILKGFVYGNMEHFQSLLPDENTSGVYLYPEPFLEQSSSTGKETIVWILHSHYMDGDNRAEELDSIEALLNLICSYITEIIWKTNRLSLLEARETLSEGEHCIDKSGFCQNLVFLNRTSTPGTTVIDDKKEVLDNLKKIQPTLNKSLLANIQCISLANMVDFRESLHDSRGKLIITAGMYKNLQKVVKTVAADDDFPWKETNGEALLLGEMKDYLTSSVELINRKFALIPKQTMKNVTEPLPMPKDLNKSINQNNLQDPPKVQNINFKNGGLQAKEIIEVVVGKMLPSPEDVVGAIEPGKGGIPSRPRILRENSPLDPSPHGYSLRSQKGKLNEHDSQPGSGSGLSTVNPSSGETSGTPESGQFNPPQQPPPVPLRRKKLSRDGDPWVLIEADGELREVKVDDTNGKRSDHSTPATLQLQQKKTLGFEKMPGRSLKEKHLCDDGDQSPEVKNEIEEKRRLAEDKQRLVEKQKLADEKQRLAEEQKLAEAEKKATEERILTKVVATAFQEMIKIMLTYLNDWVNTTLTMNTINDNLCSKIYQRCLDEVGQKYKVVEKMNDILLKKFWEKLTTTSVSINNTMQKLDKAIQDFHLKVWTKFQDSGCFETTHLEEFIEKQIQSSLIGLGEQSKPYAERACKRLQQIYIEHNKIIVEMEQLNANICTTKIRNQYKTAMDKTISKGPFTPDELQRIHFSVSDKYLSSLKFALRFTLIKENVAVVEHIITCLQDTLNVDFQHYKTENLNMLASKLKQLNDSIKACKKQYDVTMDNCLQENPNGIDGRELKKLHDDTQAKAKERLEDDIGNGKIDQVNPLKLHLKTLQKHISESWISFMEENERCRKASSKTEVTEEECEKKRREELESLKQKTLGSSSGIKDPLRAFEQSSQKKAPAEARYPQEEVEAMEVDGDPAPTKSETLPPLIFQLSLSKVMMGVAARSSSGFHFVDQVDTPALVAVTRNDVWIFGNDVERQLRANGDSEFEWVWSIGDCFKNNEGKETWSQEVTILGDKHVITFEFLLGLLLKSLKDKVEKQMEGLVTKAIIIVPFWTTSCQRQGIKDAGTIAGFSNVFLISENSAVAYNFAKTTLPTHSVVLSENSGQVDIALYTFHQYAGAELFMEGHSRVQVNAAQEQSPGIIQQIIAGLQWYYYGMDPEDSGVAVGKAWATALKEGGNSFNRRYSDYKVSVVISYETEKWRDILSTFAQTISSSTVAVQEMHAGLHGALLFAHNPASIQACIRDRLPYDILRMSPPDSKISMVQTKMMFLSGTKPLKLSSSLKSNETETTYYQTAEIIGNGRVNIGELILKDVPKKPFQMEPLLEVNNEGIVSLQHVTIKQFLPYTRGMYKQNMYIAAHHQYDWLTPNLSEESMGVFFSLVEPLLERSATNSQVSLAKQALVQRAEGLLRRIGNGEGTFRSDVGRSMIIHEIEGIIQLLNHPKFSDFQSQNSVLSQISAKYSLNN